LVQNLLHEVQEKILVLLFAIAHVYRTQGSSRS